MGKKLTLHFEKGIIPISKGEITMTVIVESIKTFFESIFGNAYLVGFIISMIPLIELKGGILYMILQTGNILASFAVGFLGSTIIAPVLLLVFMPVIAWMKTTKLLRKIAEWLEGHFKKKSAELSARADQSVGDTEEKRLKNIERAKYIGLFIFTAIPLPLTGCWTASVVASILHLDYKKSLLFIVLGNIVAGVAITVLGGVLNIAI